MIAPNRKGVRGFLIDAPEAGKIRGIRDGAILIEDGLIAAVGHFEDVRTLAPDLRWQHSPEAIVVPGLIDVHAHLPQYPAVARVEPALLPWLERHVFPLERGFNATVARREAPLFFEALARHGTTCAMLYTTIYEESCHAAFEAAEASGLRVIMGKVMMDHGSYGGLPAEKILPLSLEQSERLCRRWHGRDQGRIEYAFSPRFAVTCTAELMRGAAELTAKFDAYLQTHLSENHEEIKTVQRRFPSAASYADVYAQCGMLGDRSIFAHCIHLSDDEIRLLADSRSVVAHCPTSNFFLQSGIMPMNRLQAAGLRIGLGSDVAAGPELNLWQVMRSAIEAQQARSFFEPDLPVPTVADIFHLATLGGAAALGKERIVGSFEIGKEADLVVLDLAQVLPYGLRGNIHADLAPQDVIALFVYRGGSHAVVETFVRGRSVFRAPAPLLL